MRRINRSYTFNEHTDDYDLFYDAVETLFEDNYHKEALRLVGVFMNSVIQKKDLKQDYNLFTYQEFSKREVALYQRDKKKRTS